MSLSNIFGLVPFDSFTLSENYGTLHLYYHYYLESLSRSDSRGFADKLLKDLQGLRAAIPESCAVVQM